MFYLQRSKNSSWAVVFVRSAGSSTSSASVIVFGEYRLFLAFFKNMKPFSLI